MADLSGKMLGKYHLIERLGRGGMAEVYRAFQPSLEREVAVKVMHGYLAEDADFVGRFRREAKAIATLRHPNIVQVYDFDVEGDIYYMVMEYISGETLKGRIERFNAAGKRMPLDEVARVLRELGEALDYAHAQGRIHRDIKPANVMFDGDRLVLTDFGIASIVGGTRYTATGAMVGTPAYMSPEQCRGEPGDARSDIYSLGIVLYEMLTGRVPYDADTPLAIVMKHLHDPLPRPTQIVPDLAPQVEQVILKALAKDPQDRYPSATALAEAFTDALAGRETLTGVAAPVAAAAPEKPLPLPEEVRPRPFGVFPSRRHLYWAIGGAAVAFVAALALVGVFVVWPQLREREPTPPVINRGVPTPLVVASEVSPAPPTALAAAVPTMGSVPAGPEAAALYQAGREAMDSMDFEAAIAQFSAALEADPTFAEAYHMRGVAYGEMGQLEEALADLTLAIELQPDLAAAYLDRGHLYIWLDRPEDGRADFTRAIELDPGLAEAYMGRALTYYWDGDYETALGDLDQALALNPDLVEARNIRGDIHYTRGEYDLALADLSHVVELDPTNTYAHRLIGTIHYFRGEFEEAVASFDLGLQYAPDEADLYFGRGVAYLMLGDHDSALDSFDQALSLEPRFSGAHYGRGLTYVDQGRLEEAIAEFDVVAEDTGESYQWPFFPDRSVYLDRGLAYKDLGRYDQALADLNLAIARTPYWHLPYYYRGLLYKEMGNTEAAIADMQMLLELAPDDEWRDRATAELEALQGP